ncbi:MAG: hypothetical protein ABDH21_04010 [bacterium]
MENLEYKIADFFKKHKIESIGILFLESIYPFRRIVANVFAFGEPFLSIFVNQQIVSEFYEIFYDKKRYDKLYDLLKAVDEERDYENNQRSTENN